MSIGNFELALSKLMFEHHPTILVGDVDAAACAAVALSDMLGGLLAGMILRNPEQTEEAMKMVFDRIGNAMNFTMKKAVEIAERGGETLQ